MEKSLKGEKTKFANADVVNVPWWVKVAAEHDPG